MSAATDFTTETAPGLAFPPDGVPAMLARIDATLDDRQQRIARELAEDEARAEGRLLRRIWRNFHD